MELIYYFIIMMVTIVDKERSGHTGGGVRIEE